MCIFLDKYILSSAVSADSAARSYTSARLRSSALDEAAAAPTHTAPCPAHAHVHTQTHTPLAPAGDNSTGAANVDVHVSAYIDRMLRIDDREYEFEVRPGVGVWFAAGALCVPSTLRRQ